MAASCSVFRFVSTFRPPVVYRAFRRCSTSSRASKTTTEEPAGEELNQTKLSRDVRRLLRSVPFPVVVVTTAKYTTNPSDSGYLRGVTCSSFTSVSLQPPIVSFCMNKPSRMHSLLVETQHCAVHILSKDQIHYSVHFATPVADGQDQFQSVPHTLGHKGVPLITGAAAVLQCRAHQVHDIGDHHVWYGEVLDTSSEDTVKEPLLYFARSYRSIGDEAFMNAFEDATLLFEDWTHEAHLRMAWNYIRRHGKENAVPKIQRGIKKFNEQNKDKVKRGYHETVTQFYIHAVSEAIQKMDCPELTFEEFVAQNPHLMDPQLPLYYYSPDRLNSEDARVRFVPPDRQQLPSTS
ncbi:PREDICTED: uncharacterized protein LOC109485261 [Branchiostoma belcheri]|uniref:Uncharacterized protein LOC109485261 n=1 Tax=Branchiostoma belcheri TaxID=7741 RepID=A0A6P5AMK9_BRABE|nr:PREDICTED: uncharacterized protein LOC109485261 [Branchiostoma belcheri]